MNDPGIKMVVFDMAGTVVNEKNVVYKTLQKALNTAGYQVLFENVLSIAGGKEKLQAIKDVIDQVEQSGPSPEEVYKIFLEQLKEAYDNLDVCTYDGIDDLMLRLRRRRIQIVLNTGYNSVTAVNLLKKMNWQQGKEYDLLVTADQVENSRPAPDMILLAMESCDITNAQNVAKVGDSDIDIQEGQAAGCQLTIGVTTGAHTHDQLAASNPSFILDSLVNLDELLP